jgi:hypothetical protein
MQLTNSIKRAPKWAIFTVMGVAGGAIALKVWKGRDAESTDADTGTEVGNPQYGSVGTSGSTPVITPPVVISGGEGEGSGAAQVVETLGSSFETLVSSLTGLATGEQELAGTLAGGLVTNSEGILELAEAGSSPQPVAQNPTPVIVNVPSPTPTPSGPSQAVVTTEKPCCLYNGRPLSYWKGNQKNGKWGWPDGQGYVHTRPFEGNKPCDGGGVAPGSHREC